MSIYRRNAKRDANEPEVVQALQACGWNVRRISEAGLPDLLLWRGQGPQIRFVEVKVPKGRMQKTQRWWEGVFPVAIIRSAEQAIEWSKEQP